MGAASGPGNAIEVDGVWKRFGPRDALVNVSFDVAPGTCAAVLGENGSGKTTLLRILATLGAPTEGRVSVAGFAVDTAAQAVRARIGVVLARHMLPRDFTLEEALRYYADLYGLASASPRIEELVARVGLSTRLRDPVRTFSRGMGQRASVARALLHDPDVLLLDEPFTALDAAGCRIVSEVIREFRDRGKTVLLVTHDIDRATELADRTILLDRGRVAFDGEPAEASARLAGAAAS